MLQTKQQKDYTTKQYSFIILIPENLCKFVFLNLKYQLLICWWLDVNDVIECSQIHSPKIVLAYVYVIPVTRFSKETSFWG